jgi:hypothetical protein
MEAGLESCSSMFELNVYGDFLWKKETMKIDGSEKRQKNRGSQTICINFGSFIFFNKGR